MSDGIIMVVIYVSLKNVCSIPSISLFLIFFYRWSFTIGVDFSFFSFSFSFLLDLFFLFFLIICFYCGLNILVPEVMVPYEK